jgi:hypothetical protein
MKMGEPISATAVAPSGDPFKPGRSPRRSAAPTLSVIFIEVPHDLFKLTTADENG